MSTVAVLSDERLAEMRRVADDVDCRLRWHTADNVLNGSARIDLKDARHIALFEPVVVLELLDALEAARRRVVILERVINSNVDPFECDAVDQMVVNEIAARLQSLAEAEPTPHQEPG